MGLIVSTNCGPEPFDEDLLGVLGDNASYKEVEEFYAANDYARSCYYEEGLVQCNATYVVPKLPFTTTTNTGCPFSPELCLDSRWTMTMDTGLLDSRAHLGLNTPDADRVFYRKLASCAPLQTKGYTYVLATDPPTWVANYSTSGPEVYHNGSYSMLSMFSENGTVLNQPYQLRYESEASCDTIY